MHTNSVGCVLAGRRYALLGDADGVRVNLC